MRPHESDTAAQALAPIPYDTRGTGLARDAHIQPVLVGAPGAGSP